jgi:hypothetical protein
MEAKFASFRFLRFVTVWSRELLSSFWNRSSKLTFNRDRMDIDPNGLHMVAQRIKDGEVMHLLKMMVKATGKKGVPRGGVISEIALAERDA